MKSFANKCVKNDETKFMFPTHETIQNTRNSEKFTVPFAHHERFKNSAKVAMTRFLNEKSK